MATQNNRPVINLFFDEDGNLNVSLGNIPQNSNSTPDRLETKFSSQVPPVSLTRKRKLNDQGQSSTSKVLNNSNVIANPVNPDYDRSRSLDHKYQDPEDLMALTSKWNSMSPDQIKTLVFETVSSKLDTMSNNETLEIVNIRDKLNFIFNDEHQIVLPSLNPIKKKCLPKTREELLEILTIIRDGLSSNKKHDNRRFHYEIKLWEERIDDLSLYLEIPKCYLGINFESDGFFYGPMSFLNKDGISINCMEGIIPLPQLVNDCHNFKLLTFDVEAVIIFEDKTSFNKAVKLYGKRNQFLFLTGCGQPSHGTLRFLSKLYSTFHFLQYTCFSNGNPNGLQIFASYKFGNPKNLYSGECLICPRLIRLGFTMADFDILEESTLSCLRGRTELSLNDYRKIKGLRAKPYCKGAFLTEVDEMESSGYKCDIHILRDKFGSYLMINEQT